MSHVILDSTLKQGGQVLNRVESTEYSQATTIHYPHTGLPYDTAYGWTGQMSRLNARCLPTVV